eukprot:COSAG02_NODE_2291_length_9203_cov_4.256920_2_plen_192_part_00
MVYRCRTFDLLDATHPLADCALHNVRVEQVGSRRSSHSRDGGRDSATFEEPLRPGAPPRQPKPKGKAAEALLARKKLLVLCDLPKRGDNRPGYHMLSTERYQGEMKVMWDKKQRKQKKERERRRQAALMAAEARGEHPQGVAQNIRPSSADPLTYNLRIQLPEHLGFPAHSRVSQSAIFPSPCLMFLLHCV